MKHTNNPNLGMTELCTGALMINFKAYKFSSFSLLNKFSEEFKNKGPRNIPTRIYYSFFFLWSEGSTSVIDTF